jgi:hypothetical protein
MSQGRTFMGRKKVRSAEAADTAGGPSKYQAVKRLVESLPDISRTDIVARLKAEGIDVDLDMASSYASKARNELGTGKRRRRKRGRPRAAEATVSAPAAPKARAATTGISTDQVVELASIVKKVGAEEVVRLVQAIK